MANFPDIPVPRKGDPDGNYDTLAAIRAILTGHAFAGAGKSVSVRVTDAEVSAIALALRVTDAEVSAIALALRVTDAEAEAIAVALRVTDAEAEAIAVALRVTDVETDDLPKDGSEDMTGTLTFDPGSDADMTLLKVGVTGDPEFSWVEGGDHFDSSKGLRLPVAPSPSIANVAYREGIVRGWCKWNPAATQLDSFNVSGINDNGTGDWGIVWDTNFGDSDYAPVADQSQTFWVAHAMVGISGADIRVRVTDTVSTLKDPNFISVIALGNQ